MFSFLSYGRSQPAVWLKGLDKVTGRIHDLQVLVGEKTHFGTLEITVRHVIKRPIRWRLKLLCF